LENLAYTLHSPQVSVAVFWVFFNFHCALGDGALSPPNEHERFQLGAICTSPYLRLQEKRRFITTAYYFWHFLVWTLLFNMCAAIITSLISPTPKEDQVCCPLSTHAPRDRWPFFLCGQDLARLGVACVAFLPTAACEHD